MVGFEALLRRRGIGKQDLEDTSRNAHHTLVFANTYSEFDNGALGIPSGVRWKAEKHGSPGCSANVLTNIPQIDRSVESSDLVVPVAADHRGARRYSGLRESPDRNS